MYMSFKFRKILNILLICLVMILTGCGNVEEKINPEISSESTSEEVTNEISKEISVASNVDKEISSENSEESNMEKVLFFATILHNYQLEEYTDTDIKYYFVVQNDGTVWTMDNNCEADNYEFVTKFAGHDDSAWELADHLENIGSLSAEDTQKLSEYISGIDFNSEDYDRLRDIGEEPEVIETVYYNYLCRIPDDKSRWFRIMDTGENQGVSYRTYDENALSAVDLIEHNQLYIDWCEKINRIN